MKVLIVCATLNEIKLIKAKLCGRQNGHETKAIRYKNLKIRLLVTGAGIVATTYFLQKKLTEKKYDLVLNIGVSGCFDKKVKIGSVFHVVSDCFADAGAEDDKKFLSLFDLGLAGKNDYPFTDGKILNTKFRKYEALTGLPEAHAITVNKAHGNHSSIEKTVKRYSPDLESMEGAAFFYVCRMEKVPFIQLRAVSNLVEKRNRKAWNIPLALKNLKVSTVQLLEELSAINGKH